MQSPQKTQWSGDWSKNTITSLCLLRFLVWTNLTQIKRYFVMSEHSSRLPLLSTIDRTPFFLFLFFFLNVFFFFYSLSKILALTFLSLRVHARIVYFAIQYMKTDRTLVTTKISQPPSLFSSVFYAHIYLYIYTLYFSNSSTHQNQNNKKDWYDRKIASLK